MGNKEWLQSPIFTGITPNGNTNSRDCWGPVQTFVTLTCPLLSMRELVSEDSIVGFLGCRGTVENMHLKCPRQYDRRPEGQVLILGPSHLPFHPGSTLAVSVGWAA